MFTALVLALAHRDGIIAIDDLVVGQVKKGVWRTTDKGKTDPVRMLRLRNGFALGLDGTLSQVDATVKYFEDDGPEGLHSWYVEPKSEDVATWFGPQPPVPTILKVSPTSPTYVAVLAGFLKSKGIKAEARLESVVLADLDGNGTREAVLFAQSLPEEEMWGTLSLTGENKHPQDYAGVLIRYVSGKTTKILPAIWTDGRKCGLEGFWKFAGAWDLDGTPGLELLVASRYYEASGGMVLRFSKGKLKTLAEHVIGV